MEEDIKPRYLGDGVYASFDGYHINLAINHHSNHAVALEPEVIEALIRYSNYIWKEKDLRNEYIQT